MRSFTGDGRRVGAVTALGLVVAALGGCFPDYAVGAAGDASTGDDGQGGDASNIDSGAMGDGGPADGTLADGGDARAADSSAADTGAGDAGVGDASTADTSAGDTSMGDANAGDASAGDASAGDANASDAASVDSGVIGDAGPIPVVPNCGDMSGLQANSPWPMEGYCPAQRRRSPLPGPTTQPQEHWHKAIQATSSIAPLIMADGTVLAVSITTAPVTSTLYAYAPDGTPAWHWSPPSGDQITWSPAIANDGTIYVPCTNHVYGVVAGNVTVTSVGVGTRGDLVIGPGPILYVDDPSSTLWALHADGTKFWTASIPHAVDYMVPVFGNASTLYQVDNGGSVSTVTASGGTVSHLGTVDVTAAAEAMFAPDGALRIVTDATGRVWSMTTSGTVSWTWPALDAGSPGTPRTPAVGDSSEVYVAYGGSEVFQIDATGKQAWSTHTAPGCNAITLGSDGTVYAGCIDGLNAYDPSTNTRLWNLAGSTTGLDYSISIGRNDVLYVSCSDGSLYAIGP